MPSLKRAEPLYELENDLQVTAADVEALSRARDLDWLSPKEYIAWCTYLTRNLASSRDDLNTEDNQPFEL
jgi:hypothetical protein